MIRTEKRLKRLEYHTSPRERDKMTKLAEQLGDGRYIVDPSKIEWDDVLRYEAALDRGPFPMEPPEGFLKRCVRTLMGIPEPTDPFIERHQEAVTTMLDMASHRQEGSH
jgi:hypothetical protein